MYNIEVYDNTVPYDIHKAAYDYLQVQRWYTGYREMPQLDIIPAQDGWVDTTPPQVHHSITRAPFAAKAEHLAYHPPIERLFNYINEHVYNGRLALDGLLEPSPGLNYPERSYYKGDVQLTTNVPFVDETQHWTKEIAEMGSIAYLQAQPYETMRQTRPPHRDWKPRSIETNDNNYCTLMYVANLVWKPEWYGEFTMFDNADENIQGTDYNSLHTNRGVAVGWPSNMIDNVPGRIVVQDGRQLHATRAVGELAPEPTLHINFRVSIRD